MRGRKPIPSQMRGRRPPSEPVPPDALPRCPDHLSPVARKEWRRLAGPLHRMGVLTVVDRAAMAAYCQAWARWVEAEQKLAETPPLLKMPSGYVQQSPWLSIANKQLEIMNRFMGELGLTPAARRRVTALANPEATPQELVIIRTIYDPAPTGPGIEGGNRNVEGRASGAALQAEPREEAGPAADETLRRRTIAQRG